MASTDTQGGRNFIYIQFEQFCEFFCRRLPFKLLFQHGIGLCNPVCQSDFIQWETNNARLFGQRLKDALADPPHCIRNEFETTSFIETLCGLDKSQVALIDEVWQ